MQKPRLTISATALVQMTWSLLINHTCNSLNHFVSELLYLNVHPTFANEIIESLFKNQALYLGMLGEFPLEIELHTIYNFKMKTSHLFSYLALSDYYVTLFCRCVHDQSKF